MSVDTEIDLDSILSEIGNFGKFQVINLILLSIPVILGGAHILSFVFTAGNLDYRCFVPICDSSESEYQEYDVPWLKNMIPYENGEYMKCSYYGVNEINNCTDIDTFNTSEILTCDNFIYKDNERTIVNEFNITCTENKWKLALVGTIGGVAFLVCMPFLGYISDRFGRKNVLMVSILSRGIFGIIRAFSLNYTMFLITEFFDIGLGSVAFSAVFILAVEILSPKKRVLAGTILSAVYSLGEVFLGLTALYTQNFRYTLLIISVPDIFLISYFWLIPESIRWLLAQNRYDDVRRIILQIANRNGTHVRDDILQTLDKLNLNRKFANVTTVTSDVDVDSGDETMIELRTLPGKEVEEKMLQQKNLLVSIIKSPVLLLRLVCCVFCWFTIKFVFFGMSLTAVGLAGDKYTNFILASIIELPGFLLSQFLLDIIGRKWSVCISLVLSGVFCILAHYLSDNPIISLVLFLCGKCAITYSFTAIYVQTAELYPTLVRHTIFSICVTLGHIGATVAPLTPLLANYMPSLPIILFGGSSILTGLVSLHLPETLNTPLPDTVEDAEIIGKRK